MFSDWGPPPFYLLTSLPVQGTLVAVADRQC